MSTGKQTTVIVGTIIASVLAVGGFLSAQLAGQMGAVNTRIDEVHGRIDEVHDRIDEVNGRIDEVNERVGDLRTEMNRQFDRLEARMDGFDERLRVVETTVARLDASSALSPSG